MSSGDDDVEQEPETSDAGRVIYPSPGAPLEVARKLYKHYRVGGTSDGMRTLLAWRGGFHHWQTTHWAELDIAHLRSDIYDALGKVDYKHPIREKGEITGYEIRNWDPDKRKVANVLEALAAIGHLSTTVDTPSWIDLHDVAKTPASQMISCTNGLLDLSTRTVHQHTPALFNVVSVPFNYDRNAPSPRVWFDFLSSVWPDDRDSIALLQEFMGYLLSGRTDLQKLLLMIGPTRSGKGTIARLMHKLLGTGNVCGPTLSSLGTNFGLSPLLGKPLAVIADSRLSSKSPSNTIVERLLSITGEDLMTVDRKFKDPWNGRLSTRIVILSNELPRFHDSSGAIVNRMLVLQMTKSFLGDEDHELDNKLVPELHGILNWALDGLDRLNTAGKFTVPKASKDSTNLMHDLASPVSAFVRDRCNREPAESVLRDALYEAWKTWCEDNGHLPGAKSTFGRDLRAVVPELQSSQRRINGKQVWQYDRIGLLHPALNAESLVSPVSDDESAGQGSDRGTRKPEPALCQPLFEDQTALSGTGTPAPDTGSPVSSDDANQQVNVPDIGDTGVSAFKAQRKGDEGVQQAGPSPKSMPERLPGTTSSSPRRRERTYRGKPLSEHPQCRICGNPVTSGQGETHYSCKQQAEAS